MADTTEKASISAKKFALLTGIPRTSLRRLMANGQIPQNPDKSLPMPEALVAAHALRELQLNQPAPATSQPEQPKTRALPAAALKSMEARAKADLEKTQQDVIAKEHRSKLLELEVQRKRGELVPIDEVRADAIAAGGVIRQRLLQIAARVAPQVHAIALGPAPGALLRIEQAIAAEVNAALAVLNATKFGAETR